MNYILIANIKDKTVENNKIVLKNRKLFMTKICVWVIMITELFCSVYSLNHNMRY